MARRFDNKVGLVSGAANGIGKATAILFAKEGASVIIVDRNETGARITFDECNNFGALQNLMLVADLTVTSDIHNIVNESVEKFGRIDVLVNCAGIGRQNSISSPHLLADYELIFNVNVKAALLLTQLCVPYLIETKGAIVNVASISSFKPSDVMLVYTMSKAALTMLTKNLACDLGKRGVRVNEVIPNYTATGLYKEFGWSDTEEQYIIDEGSRSNPLNKINEPEDVAKAILFLSSNDASTINGVSLLVDGGLFLAPNNHGGEQ